MKRLMISLMLGLFLISLVSAADSVTSEPICGSVQISECGDDDNLISCLNSYKNDEASKLNFKECSRVWKAEHPQRCERKKMKVLVSCVNEYKSGDKTFSELLECIQVFNLVSCERSRFTLVKGLVEDSKQDARFYRRLERFLESDKFVRMFEDIPEEDRHYCPIGGNGADACTLNYQPVIGYGVTRSFRRTEKVYSNRCFACMHPQVLFWVSDPSWLY